MMIDEVRGGEREERREGGGEYVDYSIENIIDVIIDFKTWKRKRRKRKWKTKRKEGGWAKKNHFRFHDKKEKRGGNTYPLYLQRTFYMT